MIVIQWAATIFLWIVAGAFAMSDCLMLLALVYHRKDRDFVLVIGVVILIFAIFAAGAAYGALAVGRSLA